MDAIKLDSKGAEVKKWQFFLAGQGYTKVIADGSFGSATEQATKDWQKKNGLTGDGVVGNYTYTIAMQKGFMLVTNTEDESKKGINWPDKPTFTPLTTPQMQSMFGKFDYTVNADTSIKILGDWEKNNIVSIPMPQVSAIGPYKPKSIRVHTKAAKQFTDLFNAWEKAGLLDRILSYDGSYMPRLMRGSTNLSRHAWGTAFDINVPWNGLNVIPPKLGEKGSVRELVSIANKNGFYWGGHFGRLDGMHFEIAQLK
jgi:peptidoglycan hydrolase-like protein with peptidoglycan-binding domain